MCSGMTLSNFIVNTTQFLNFIEFIHIYTFIVLTFYTNCIQKCYIHIFTNNDFNNFNEVPKWPIRNVIHIFTFY